MHKDIKYALPATGTKMLYIKVSKISQPLCLAMCTIVYNYIDNWLTSADTARVLNFTQIRLPVIPKNIVFVSIYCSVSQT